MWFKWILVGVFLTDMIKTICDVGKDRAPISHELALTVMVLEVALIAGILYYWSACQ